MSDSEELDPREELAKRRAAAMLAVLDHRDEIDAEIMELRAEIIKKYDNLTSAELEVLDAGLTALINAKLSQVLVDIEGPVVLDRFFQYITNPAATVARQERAQFLAACKQLGIADPYGEEKGGKGRGAHRGRGA